MKMKTTNSRLVITGMGAVTPIGIGVENYWKKSCGRKMRRGSDYPL